MIDKIIDTISKPFVSASTKYFDNKYMFYALLGVFLLAFLTMIFVIFSAITK